VDRAGSPWVDASYSQGTQVGSRNLMVNQFIAAPPGVVWPVLVGRAPLPADAFQERRWLRDAVEAALSRGKTAVVTQVLAGDGGTGKTQMAAKIFERVRRDGVDLAVWVTATSRAGVLATYAQAYAVTHPGAGDGDAERVAEAFLAWLATTSRSWIVVLDDVADPGDLVGLWPTGSAGRVLVTTRRRDAALAARGRVVDVGVFTPEEALDYLTAKFTPVAGMPADTLVQADELAGELGHLPLALAHAAAVIVNDAITCASYRALLADRRHTLSEVFPTDPNVSGDEYGQTLAGAWSLAAERANELAPAGLAEPLLGLVAVLDPNGVPESVLTSRSVRAYLGGVSLAGARRALRNLHRLSLITHDPNDPVRSVRMHALAQRSTVENTTPDSLAEAVHVAADALVENWPEAERPAGLGQVMRAGATAVLGHGAQALLQPAVHAVRFRYGASLGEAGLVSDAIEYFETLLDGCSRTLGPDHPDTLSARYEIAYWRGESGDFAGAAAALEELLADREMVLGPKHPDTLGTGLGVAYWRGHAGDPAGAAAATEALLRESLPVLGPDHPTNLSARHNLAHWRGLTGDLAGAISAYEQLLADQARVLGDDHFDTLDTRRNLADWRGRAGDPAAAVAALEELLTVYPRVLGADHAHVLHARENLAQWRGQAGDPSGAVGAFEELLADRLRVLGADHPHTLVSRDQLAEWSGHAGDPAGAARAYEELLADRLRLLGPDHPHTLNTRCQLVSWRGEAEGATAALGLLAPLRDDMLRVLGADHPGTLALRHNLAYWMGRAGNVAEATAEFEQLLTDQIRMLGSDHPQTLITRRRLAELRG
jgi:tetratricopeptide (TPR) repeat protein